MDVLIKFLVWIAQLLIGLGLAMFSVWVAVRMLDRIVKEIDYEDELKKGNMAIGAMLGGVVIATALVTSSGVVGLTDAVTAVASGSSFGTWARAIGSGIVQLGAGIVLAVVSISLGFRIWDRLTTKIEETDELKKGNIAIGIVMAAIVVAVAIVVRSGLSGLAGAIGASQ